VTLTPQAVRRVNDVFTIVGILLFAALGVISSVQSNTFEYPLGIALGLGICMYGFLVIQWRLNGVPRLKQAFLLLLVLVPLTVTLVGFFYYGVWSSLKHTYSTLRGALPSSMFSYGLTVIATLALGVLLFLFRLRARFFYGVTEAVVGVAVAVHKVPFGASDPVTWDSTIYLALLTAGVYLVVRGLDNMRSGLQPETYDEILRSYKEYEADYLARLEKRQFRSTKS